MTEPFLPEDLVPKSFINQFGSQIKFALGGWDRLRFHASLRPLFSPQWMRAYLCAAKVRLKDFASHAKALTDRLVQGAQSIAASARRPYHYLRSPQNSKEASSRTSPAATKCARASSRCSAPSNPAWW